MVGCISGIVPLILLLQLVPALPNRSVDVRSLAKEEPADPPGLDTFFNETDPNGSGAQPLIDDNSLLARTDGAGSGEYHWDARVNPESASNTCWWMYCHPDGSETITYARTRGTRGKYSGQEKAPVSNAESRAKYHLNHVPATQAKFNRLKSGKWVDLTGNELETKVTDEWPPASAEEGGTGASLMATTADDGSAQGGKMVALWKQKDPKTLKVKIVMTGFDDHGLDARSKAILNYCTCKGMTGAAKETCCRPNDNMFQRIPSGDAKKFQDVYRKTDVHHLVNRHAKG